MSDIWKMLAKEFSEEELKEFKTGFEAWKEPEVLQGETVLADLREWQKQAGKAPPRGVQGISFAVLPAYRGTGLGKRLVVYSENLNFDYIWGFHVKTLNNIDHWKKVRDVVIDDYSHYTTIKKLIL
jgi:GNAT superfamily N-acetyltransferase